jgi:Domain of unknown function (DUF3303)
MEFMITYTINDPRVSLPRFLKWAPPEGYEVKGHYTAADGRGFLLVEAESALALVEASSAFSDELDFDIVPVVPIEEAVPVLLKVHAWIDSTEQGD